MSRKIRMISLVKFIGFKSNMTLFATIVIMCFIFSSCTYSQKKQVPKGQVSNTQKTNSSIGTLDVQTQESATGDPWELVDKKNIDIDNDGKIDIIYLYWFQNINSIPKLKLIINNNEKIIEFDPSKTIGVNSIMLKQFVKLSNGNKGLLIKLISEGGDSDQSFLLFSYSNSEITTILDGVNQPFNSQENYKVKYISNYNIEFKDTTTGFNVKYVATLYKSADDGVKRLKTINDRKTSEISANYLNIMVEDMNHDGIDEIICSKYIPGLYHADYLGIINYTFSLKNGKYSLSNEALSYDGESEFSIVKKIELK